MLHSMLVVETRPNREQESENGKSSKINLLFDLLGGYRSGILKSEIASLKPMFKAGLRNQRPARFFNAARVWLG